MFDIDEDYYSIAQDRINNHVQQLAHWACHDAKPVKKQKISY